MQGEREQQRWKLVGEVFQGALERSIAARRECVEAASGGDRRVALEVLSLLNSDDDAEEMLPSVVADEVGHLTQWRARRRLAQR